MPEKDTPPFLASLADTKEVIEAMRAELAGVERQKRELDEKVNDLNVRIGAFNALRQAHGLQPL